MLERKRALRGPIFTRHVPPSDPSSCRQRRASATLWSRSVSTTVMHCFATAKAPDATKSQSPARTVKSAPLARSEPKPEQAHASDSWQLGRHSSTGKVCGDSGEQRREMNGKMVQTSEFVQRKVFTKQP